MLRQSTIPLPTNEDLNDDAWIPTVLPPRYGNEAACEILSSLDCASHMRAEGRALANHHKVCEGASFLKLAPDVDLIVVRGGQPLHHDRHMSGQAVKGRAVEHVWNWVLSSDGDQLLLVEIAQHTFAHLSLDAGTFVYFNTMNRHLVSRSDPQACVVLAQVCGYRPDEAMAAAGKLREGLTEQSSTQ